MLLNAQKSALQKHKNQPEKISLLCQPHADWLSGQVK